MTAGLTLPFITQSDPDRAGEGSLDPLGLFGIADQVATSLAPEVTARMSRIRFLTAIAACSHVVEDPLGLMAADGTPAYLAFEWHIVEAFARKPPESGSEAIPGIGKARARLRVKQRHLDAGSYLVTPKVFGFHGVYKRLAKDLEIVDDNLLLMPRGTELLSVWEREQDLEGFTTRRRGTAGGRLAEKLSGEVRRGLAEGGVRMSPSSSWWREISRVFAPGGAGRRERRKLWSWLVDEHPVRKELAVLVANDRDATTSEREVVEGLLRGPLSSELRDRLQAVVDYESMAALLDDLFRLLRSLASQRSPSAVTVAEAAAHPAAVAAAETLPGAVTRARDSLAQMELDLLLEHHLGQFAVRTTPHELVEAILDRHDHVQDAKAKRPWFERDDAGFRVRGIGRFDDPWEPRVEYLHPYRIYALRAFARDLRPAVSS